MIRARRQNGGDLGWNRRGHMVPEFDRWMFALPPGQLSPVIETAFGYPHHSRRPRAARRGEGAPHPHRPKIDSADVARAHLEADSVAAAWRAGAPFDSLAKKHHDFARAKRRAAHPIPACAAADRVPAGVRGQEGEGHRRRSRFPGNATVPAKVVVAQLDQRRGRRRPHARRGEGALPLAPRRRGRRQAPAWIRCASRRTSAIHEDALILTPRRGGSGYAPAP